MLLMFLIFVVLTKFQQFQKQNFVNEMFFMKFWVEKKINQLNVSKNISIQLLKYTIQLALLRKFLNNFFRRKTCKKFFVF